MSRSVIPFEDKWEAEVNAAGEVCHVWKGPVTQNGIPIYRKLSARNHAWREAGNPRPMGGYALRPGMSCISGCVRADHLHPRPAGELQHPDAPI